MIDHAAVWLRRPRRVLLLSVRRVPLAAFLAASVLSFVLVGRVVAEDWPQWRGPQRDAISRESGLLKSWPDGGPAVIWKAAGLGIGYSSVVIRGGQVVTMGRQGEVDVVVVALDAETGQRRWSRKIGESKRNVGSTPTFDGEYLYALAPDGDLACLHANTGDVVWQKNFARDFAGRMMSGRGNGESVLIDGERLVCTPGGSGAAIVALNKLTGDVIWKSAIAQTGPQGKDGAGYSSIVVSQAAGVRQYVQLMGRGLVGVDARDGRLLWSYNAIANDDANIPTPIVHEDYVFAANGYTAGSVLLKLTTEQKGDDGASGVKAQVVYTLTGSQFQNHHGGVVQIGDYLFAGHGNNNGLPTCVEFKTGRIRWKRRGPGVGSAAVVAADGHLVFRYQDGVVALIEASERGYNLKGTFEVPGAGGDSWSHPVVANGRLYLREHDVLWVHNLTTSVPLKTVSAPLVDQQSKAAVTALRDRGVLIQPLAKSTVNIQPQTTSSRANSYYRIMFDAAGMAETETATLMTLTESHLRPDGTMVDDVFESLKQIRPLVLSVAGTTFSDVGLKQLKELSVVGLNLESCRAVTDDGLQHLAQHDSLRGLILATTNVTQEGLRQFANRSKLVALDLELCEGIKDSACEVLGSLSQLRYLVLKKSGFERPGITAEGLQALRSLANLEVLNLYGNTLTDPGLIHLSSLTTLRELNLSLLNITDAGLAHLAPLKRLRRLDLLFSEGFAGPTLTDAAVDFLLPLENLESLNLTGSRMSDAGLGRLVSLKKLSSLHLVRTRVTAEGVQSFRQAMPDCDVVR